MLNSIFGKRKEKTGSEDNSTSPGRQLNFYQFDEEYYQILRSSHEVPETERVLTTWFWPPVYSGKLISCKTAVSLKNLDIIVADANLYNFIINTESFKEFSTFGIESRLLKTSNKDNSIHVSIDISICSIPNSYEIQIGNNQQIILVGADFHGILYGLSTLIQYFKLYCELKIETIINTTSNKTLIIPAAVISDHPATAQRAVMWSYHQQVNMSKSRILEQILLLSRLRMTTMLLVIDEPLPKSSDNDTVTDILTTASKQLIDVVPTVVVTSIHQG